MTSRKKNGNSFFKVYLKVSLVNKPNNKLVIWKYFRFIPDGNGKPSNTDKPQYKACCATITMKTSNKTNSHIHLQQRTLLEDSYNVPETQYNLSPITFGTQLV